MELSKQEIRLRWLLRILTAFFALAFLANVLVPLLWETARLFFQEHLPLVVNSAAKMGALALLAGFAAADVRKNRLLIRILIGIHILSVLVLLSFAFFGQATGTVRTVLFGGVGLDGGVLALIFFTFQATPPHLEEITVLNHSQKETIRTLADAILPPEERRVAPERIAECVDDFIRASDSPPVELIRTALDALYGVVFARELGVQSADIRSKFREALHSPVEPIRDAARVLHILITYVYYADPAVDEQVGYVRFKQRPRGKNLPVGVHSLVTHTKIPKKDYDVCIVGSGVAGSILAHRLARAGKSVLVLEAGAYYPENQTTDDELLMLASLYKGGIFQTAFGNTLPVLQAKCGGGGGVVNNAVCFRMPPFVKQAWDAYGAALDDAALKAAFDTVREEVKILPADRVMANGELRLNRSRDFFLRGVEKLGIPHGTGDPDNTRAGFYTASVNISNCVGCGYCNIGCAYERKNNSLRKYLPEAIETGHCDVVANARVEEVLTEGVGFGRLRATGLLVRFPDGGTKRVRARKYILSAGAIASSGILLRSHEISLLGLPIGERFSANVGSPLHARFTERVDAYDGLQISDYFIEQDENGTWDWVAESWFNPPATQSQAIPGYLDDHFERMKQYPYYAAVGPLVGTEPVGRVVLNPLTRRSELQFTLPDSDLTKLRRGLRRCAEIFLAAGAEEVLLMAQNQPTVGSESDLARLDRAIQTPEDLLVIGSGHPQGGNAMSDDGTNGRHRGVVGTNFQVHGVDDLYICDASVFPTSVKVNPQWTIMALADLCGQKLLRAF